MEVKDVTSLLNEVLEELNNEDAFTELHRQYRKVDSDNKEEAAQRLWEYMKEYQYIPEYFESDDDLDLAALLERIAIDNDEILALKYAFVLLHHRYMLSDILEKAFVAKMLIFFLLVHRDMTTTLLQEFIAASSDDIIYKKYLDEDDVDVNTLHFELIRAILPALEWFHMQYPDQKIYGVSDDVLELYKKFSKLRENKKNALSKFSAFCRYLYEEVANPRREIEINDCYKDESTEKSHSNNSKDKDDFEQMIDDFINSM